MPFVPLDSVGDVVDFPPLEELAPLPGAGCWPRVPLPKPFAGSLTAADPGFGVDEGGIVLKVESPLLFELGGAEGHKAWSVKLTTLSVGIDKLERTLRTRALIASE